MRWFGWTFPAPWTLAVLVCVTTIYAEPLQLNLTKSTTVRERLEVGKVPAKERQETIETLFGQVGCKIAREAVDRKSSNVICDLPGESPDTFLVGAHYDFAERGYGIVDDWSGVSMLPSLYETLRTKHLRHSYRFVAFTAEERGLVGSTRYVKEYFSKTEILPSAFINLECLGLSTPKVWVTRSDRALVRCLLEVARAVHLPFEGVNVDRVGDDDTHPFALKKIPVISIHSLTQQTWPILHSNRDSVEAVDQKDLYDAYRLVAFYLLYLDGLPMAPTSQRH